MDGYEKPKNLVRMGLGYDATGVAGEELNMGDVVVYDDSEDEWSRPDESDGHEGTLGVVLGPESSYEAGALIPIRFTGLAVVTAAGSISKGDWVASSGSDGKVQAHSELTEGTELKKMGKAKTPAGADGDEIVVNLI